MSRVKEARHKRRSHDRSAASSTNKDCLAALLGWLLPNDGIFSKIKLHGNTSWTPVNLVKLALYWAWSPSRNLTDAFTEAAECCEKMSDASPLNTYQGFMGALTRWTSTFVGLLCMVLQERMEEIGGAFWEINGWVPLAFDGSRTAAPRTELNEKAYCAPTYGQGKTAKYRRKKSKGLRRKRNLANPPQPQEPQVWVTLIWHMGLRLPWLWRLGPSNSSERAHVLDMLDTGGFPKNTLFCGDAGFVGYPLWSEILARGAHFLVRVGANVHLLSASVDYSRRKGGIVLCWPKMMQTSQSPLRLRLMKIRIGKTDMWMLTSVLDKSRLTNKQIIKFYQQRWGIEVEFRGLKQTLDRAKLRCRNDRRLLAELNWSILAMAVAELFALKEQLEKTRLRPCAAQVLPDPAKCSLANTMRALRYCLRHLNERPAPENDLRTLLRIAVTDSYDRKASKRARYRPPNPDKKPLGDPKVRKPNAQEIIQLKNLRRKAA